MDWVKHEHVAVYILKVKSLILLKSYHYRTRLLSFFSPLQFSNEHHENDQIVEYSKLNFGRQASISVWNLKKDKLKNISSEAYYTSLRKKERCVLQTLSFL